jgi:hypothetical protein
LEGDTDGIYDILETNSAVSSVPVHRSVVAKTPLLKKSRCPAQEEPLSEESKAPE